MIRQKTYLSAASLLFGPGPVAFAAVTLPVPPRTAGGQAEDIATGTPQEGIVSIAPGPETAVAATSSATSSPATTVPSDSTEQNTHALGKAALPFDSSTLPYRDTTVQAVFGNRTVAVVPDRLPPPEPPSLTDNAVFQGFVLLLAATYAMLIYRNLNDVHSLLGRISRDTLQGTRLTDEAAGSGFPRFLNTATAIGMLFMGVAVVKYADFLLPGSQTALLSHGAVLGSSLLATLAAVALALFQWLVVRTAGALTLSHSFAAQLVQLKKTYFSLLVIVTSPALLLFALCPRGSGTVWFWVVAAELVVTAVVYLGETLRLFLSKKVSILHWFLYLCTVEIFPISLLWLLAAR